MDEMLFRELIDAHGLLKSDAAASLPLQPSFLVFAQPANARIDIAAWRVHAKRFFATDIGLSADKRYPDGAPTADAANIVLSGPKGAGTRLCLATPRSDGDLVLAERADACSPTAGSGLADLARRCPTVWRVEAVGDDDALSLTLTAILASILLGPIVSVDGRSLFGVRTAREKLDRLTAPYR